MEDSRCAPRRYPCAGNRTSPTGPRAPKHRSRSGQQVVACGRDVMRRLRASTQVIHLLVCSEFETELLAARGRGCPPQQVRPGFRVGKGPGGQTPAPHLLPWASVPQAPFSSPAWICTQPHLPAFGRISTPGATASVYATEDAPPVAAQALGKLHQCRDLAFLGMSEPLPPGRSPLPGTACCP